MKFFLVSLGLAFVIQYAYACSYMRHSSHGSSYHCNAAFDNEEDMCEVNHGDDCVPLVVRPRDIPKPSVTVPVLNPIAGPCGYKKAIVKPAVIPKPVCLSSHAQSTNIHHHVSGGCGTNILIGNGGSSGNYVSGSGSGTYISGGSSGSYVSGGNSHSGTYISGGNSGSSTYVSGGSTSSGIYVSGGNSGSGTYISGSGSGSGTFITGGTTGDCTGTYISGGNYINQGTPADAVSLNLAYKLARQQYAQYAQSEDKLAFGFKKLPTEVPHKRVVKTSIPEEQIYSLNGQIVELKPVSVSSHKSLDEEAAEDLLAMEAEEHAIEMEQTPIKKLYLEEIGYGPAKATSAQFVDVPVSATIVQGDATCSSSSTHVSGCGCQSSKCKEYLPGDVEYKVIPKVDDIVIPLPEPEDSCESAEITISQEHQTGGCACQCHCTPVCLQSSHNRKQTKSSVFIQKYQH